MLRTGDPPTGVDPRPTVHRELHRSPAAAPVHRAVRPDRHFRRAALGQPVAATGYLAALDGLRAIAVAVVVAYHLGALPGGFLGVDVFFVVSGFLITRLLLAEHERTGRIALVAFWRRRFRRLLPALLVVLVAVALGSRAWLPAWRLTSIRDDAFGALAYVANWRFVVSGQSYFSQGVGPSPLRHTWSLAIEEQFYVVWPLVVVAILATAGRAGRRRVGAAALAMAVASAVWMAVASGGAEDLSRLYYGTDTRLFALGAGAWLASWWDPAAARGSLPEQLRRARRWSIAGAASVVPMGVAVALAVTDEASFYRGGFQLAAATSVVLVAGVATGRGRLARGLGHPVLVWLGRRSYGIYLWSWPTQVLATARLGLTGAGLAGVVVVVTLVLASLSYWLVEEPIRSRHLPRALAARRPPARLVRFGPLPGFAASGIAVVAVVAVLAVSSEGAPSEPNYLTVSDDEALASVQAPPPPPPPDRAAGAPSTTGRPAPAPVAPAASGAPPTTAVPGPSGPFDAAAPMVVDPEATADPAALRGRPLRVMVAGDSVAWSLGWEVEPLLDPGLRVDLRALIGCGVMPPEGRWVSGGTGPQGYAAVCPEAPEVESLGLEGRPDVVLLWLGAWEVYDQVVAGERLEVGGARYAEVLEARIQERIDRYRAVGAPTVMPVVPCFGEDAAGSQDDERREGDRVRWVNARIRAVAARNPGWVRLIDPSGKLCDGRGQALGATPDGIVLREDGSHFDADAAAWLWNGWLGGQLAEAFAPAPPPAPVGADTGDP